MEDCIFCRIVKGEIPSEKVYEDEKFLAFADANPIKEGHSLIVPKEHFETLLDLEEEYSKEYMDVIKKVSKILVEKHDAEGFNVVLNKGRVAGQIIKHIHFHIIPRKENDGVKIIG